MSNGFEYVFLSDPTQVSAQQWIASRDVDGTVLLSYVRNRAATDVQLEVLATAELSDATSWQPIPTQLVSQTPEGAVDRITLRPVHSARAQMFYRLRATIAP